MKKKMFALVCAVMLALGVLGGCANNSPAGKVEELEELKGRVVYSIGMGNVPDLVFRALLKQAGVDYRFSDVAQEGVVSLAYVSEGAEIMGGLKTGKMNYGVVSEPAATLALNNVEGAERMIDIQALYEKVTGSDNGFPQAALVVKKSFLDAHPGYVAKFVAALKADAKWAESEPAAALNAIKSAGSTSVAMLNQTIAKGCNLGFTSAADAKQQLLKFYESLRGVAKKGETPVGDTLPDDQFFKGEISGDDEQNVTAKVYAPDGAPAICLSKLIADGFEGAEFNVVLPDTIGGYVSKGTADIAVMPTNVAARLYSLDVDIVMLGVTNFGSLYLVGKA